MTDERTRKIAEAFYGNHDPNEPTAGLEAIHAAVANGDTLEATRLQLAHMERGTPIITAYLILQIVTPLLPLEIQALVAKRIVDTDIRDAAFTAMATYKQPPDVPGKSMVESLRDGEL